MKFRDKRSNVVKDVYSIEIKEDKVYIKFTEKGKEYTYRKENVELVDEKEKESCNCPFRIYELVKQCYRCHKNTSVFTYIVFNDGTNNDVVYPWDKERLLKNQDPFAHLQDPSIEYYGLKVVGDDEKLDRILIDKFPDKIKVKYSRTLGKSYPMNLCDHCGATQGWNFIYRQVNEMISKMQKMNEYHEIIY